MYLLDTHALLWFLNDDPKLPQKTKALIETTSEIFVSVGTFWEMAIKDSVHKLSLPASISAVMAACQQLGFSILPIKALHLEHLKTLPQIHRDPFDRLLICQAAAEHMTLITVDKKIAKYDVPIVWDQTLSQE